MTAAIDNKAIKALVFDLDGTLLDKECSLTESVIQALSEARKNNIRIILASGRHHAMMEPYAGLLDLDTPMICCNGAYTVSSEGKLSEDVIAIDRGILQELIALLSEHGALATFFSQEGIFANERQQYVRLLEEEIEQLPGNPENPINIESNQNKLLNKAKVVVKILAYCPDPEKAKRLRKKVGATKGVHVAMSRNGYFDITPGGVTKGAALERMLNSEQISADQVAAFGDGENDLEMLQFAGVSIAMAHGSEKLKEVASLIVDNSGPDGLAKTIESLI